MGVFRQVLTHELVIEVLTNGPTRTPLAESSYPNLGNLEIA